MQSAACCIVGNEKRRAAHVWKPAAVARGYHRVCTRMFGRSCAPSPPKHPPSPFSRLCESIKDLPPKEQASRLREFFGIVGGARPAKRSRKK